MDPANVTFRNVAAEMHDLKTGVKATEMEIVEISYPDGHVAAFPANDISPETGRKYSEMFSEKYGAFKAGRPDSDKVAQLKGEISDRQAQLDAMHKRPEDDKRVQENLGYGKMKKDGPDVDHNTAARGPAARNPKRRA